MTDSDIKDVKSGVLVVANSVVAGMRSPSSEDVSATGKNDLPKMGVFDSQRKVDQGQVLKSLSDSGIALATMPLGGRDSDSGQFHSSRVPAGSSEVGDEGFASCSDSGVGVTGSSLAGDDGSGGAVCSAVSDFENEVFENLSKAEVFGSTDFLFVGKKVTDGDAPEKGSKHESDGNANGDAPEHFSDDDAHGYAYEYVDTDDDLDDISGEEKKKGGENSDEVSLSEGIDRICVRRTDAFRLLRPHRPPKYENIIRILRASRKKARGRALQRSESVESDEDDVHNLLRSISSDHEDECRDEILDIDSGVYGSSVESTSHMPSAPPTPPTSSRRWASPSDLPEQQSPPVPKISPAAEAERLTMYRCILSSIVESETIYLECLDVVLQYMKALKATLTTSQPVISPDDFSTVFYRISELHSTHSAFLSGLKERTAQWDGTNAIGELFRVLASKLDVYASFLQNYPRAIETVRRCSAQSSQFADITRSIKLRSLQGQAQSLEDLLHRPVARVQKNALVLHDLLKYTSEHHPDHETLREALRLTQNFLTHLSMLHTEAMFPAQDRPQRHLVRNSFIVELVEGHRKLRHLFLFNDVIVCAKYKPTGRSEKFTFEVKWYISLHDIAVLNDSGPETLKESNPPNIVALKSQASTVRDQLRRMENIADNKGVSRMNQARNEKNRKKLAELEAQLVLASPNLPFRISKRNGSIHTFLITSEYERDQWGEAIKVLQDNTPGVGGSSLTLQELQNWITACRSFLKTNMGSFLLKSGRDDSLLLGDLHIVVSSLHGLTSAANMFVCFEVDSYGHFFRKAKTRVSEGIEPHWNQDFIIELEGSQTLRILCYEEHPKLGLQLRGKAHLELSRTWLNDTLSERRVSLQDLVLVLSLKFLPPEATLRRVPTGKSSGLFGANIAHICRREKRSVPFIVTRCVREVERRGMQEVGIYRVSGLASDITKLKKSFESNPYEAEQLIKEVDIHSVTGLLKLFLRELPEALYTDELYPRFFEAYSAADPEYRKTTLLKLFSSLPQLNQSIIAYLLEHLVKIHHTENMNKMSLHNLATVFGPTLIRPGAKTGNPSPAEQLAAGTVDVMAQAGILHFFLLRRAHGEPIQGVNQ
ncbi:active breakpoint cluster region-related protein isoform X2 [Macrobrachium rosenbergii]|uniref:active breakpoint cluster region-related protein isoform X2 n=1 Tax=Macrobrachium rosenbergii TaxID=79674 RepID=UPI0034D47C76